MKTSDDPLVMPRRGLGHSPYGFAGGGQRHAADTRQHPGQQGCAKSAGGDGEHGYRCNQGDPQCRPHQKPHQRIAVGQFVV